MALGYRGLASARRGTKVIQTLFWTVLLSKYVFWLIAPDNYFAVMMLWIGLLAGLSALQFLRNEFVVFPLSTLFVLMLLYSGWTLVCCFLPWSEGKATGIAYAVLPLLAWPFIPPRINFIPALNAFALGVVLAASILILFITLRMDLAVLSSRSEGLAQIGPNTISFICALGLFCAWHLGAGTASGIASWLYFILVGLFSTVVLLTFSKTIILVCMVALILPRVSFGSLKSVLLTMMLGVLSSIALLMVFLLVEDQVYDYLESKNSLSNLSGRTLIWEEILHSLTGWRFILGAGYNASINVSQAAGFQVFGTEAFAQAHNALIEAIVNTGLLGAVMLMSAVVLSFAVLCRRLNTYDEHESRLSVRLMFSIMTMFLARAITEGSFAQPGTVDTAIIFFLVGCISVVKADRECRLSLRAV
ncbi:O-antigen ligase family protein [Pseudomonas sp. RW10S2]|uniref:O-antigen ligase family protein n=1 Tax=Pseudomonas sp. RW10S2 TaxID=459637 RepID=UPI0016440AFF|nr:O-antigen ligase family protein [Pseudomonas sp. RW10S2]MBC3465569.1 O-antigen ligase family protein [Pseudomonas sp. RW10S2]